MKCNQDVRNEVAKRGLKLWELADILGIADATLSRRLRHDLSDAEKAQIFMLLEKYSAGGDRVEK